MGETSQRDNSISLTRVIACLFIIICHLGSYFDSVVIGQLFNVGVPIFFLISGYLYGEKRIKNIGDFLFKRYIRLEIPALIWLAIVCISAVIRHTEIPALHKCIFIFLNLQGLNFIFTKIQDLFIGPWFFTNIMFCYIFYVVFQKIEDKHPKVYKLITVWGGMLPLLIFVLLGAFHIRVGGLLGFFMGVTLRREHLLDYPKKRYILLYGFLAIFSVAVRLFTKRFIDGTVYYDEIIVPLTYVILAAALFASIRWLFTVMPSIDKLASSRFVQHLDRISIYTYICHDFLFSGVVLSVFRWPLSMYILIPIYLCLVIIFATVLWFIGDFAADKIEKTREWLVG